MWCDKAICVALWALAINPAFANTVTCPATLAGSGTRHVLINASVYDGPPEQQADLVPEPAGRVDRWNLEGVDPYLLCQYKGTTKTIVLHAKAKKVCEAGNKPFHAYCK